MMSSIRKTLGRFVPANLHDPLGLFRRLIRSDNKAARYSLRLALTGVIASPLDLLLLPFERKLYRRARAPQQPLLFVVGAPRSGTTLTYQLLIRHFDVRFLTNLTAIFPRSPICAMRFHEPFFSRQAIQYDSYYGRTTALSGQNDGLHVWDRWFNRGQPEAGESLTANRQESLVQFWGAFEQAFERPIVNKNNSLIARSHLVADALPEAHFICLRRDPLFLAQSLLLARNEIQGSYEIPYGLHEATRESTEPVEDVCAQVEYHGRLARLQRETIGNDRFWIVRYEEICREPAELVERVADEIPGLGPPTSAPRAEPFEPSRKVRVDEQTFGRLESLLSSQR